MIPASSYRREAKLLVVLLAGSLALSGPARAARSAPAAALRVAPDPEAVAAFEEGQERFFEADYEAALAAFRRAEAIDPAPGLYYNIGITHLRLGQFEAAIEALETYLREADPPDRADIEFMIEDAKAQLDARSREPADTPPPERDVVVVEAKPHRALVITGATLLGVGAAIGLAGTLGFGLAVANRNEDIERFNETDGMSGASLDEVLELQDEADTHETLQFVSLGIGVALATAGAVALGLGLQRRARARAADRSARVVLAPTASGLALRF